RICVCFHAADGIRGLTVTGVQTCALPISCAPARPPLAPPPPARRPAPQAPGPRAPSSRRQRFPVPRLPIYRAPVAVRRREAAREIGRASCREGLRVAAAVQEGSRGRSP